MNYGALPRAVPHQFNGERQGIVFIMSGRIVQLERTGGTVGVITMLSLKALS